MNTLIILGIISLAVIGTPIFVVMGLIALTAFTFAGVEVSAVAVEIYKVASAPTLITIPLFSFAGYMMAESQTPKRLFRLADAALGWMPGGVAVVGLFVCAFFTAFTGASGITIVALGGLLYPILRKEQFSEDFSLGLITTSGSLGLLFAPSLPIILYGLVAKTDIDTLFKAAIMPGILLLGILSAYSIYVGRAKQKSTKAFSWGELLESFKGAVWEIILPFAILIGIYGGFTTVTEAATLTAFYVFIIECFIYRDLHLTKDIPRVIMDTMSLVGAILLILCCAMGVTNYLVDQEVPMKILALMRQYIDNKYTFLLFLNLLLIIVGMMMDIFSAIIVVVPLILPVSREFGVDPVHLAIIFLTNLEIGYLTPPVGVNLFISSFRFKKSIPEVTKATFPFIILLLVALLLITYIPAISLMWIR
jgi:C4-dicarboxylate transporter, DctM subunit